MSNTGYKPFEYKPVIIRKPDDMCMDQFVYENEVKRKIHEMQRTEYRRIYVTREYAIAETVKE